MITAVAYLIVGCATVKTIVAMVLMKRTALRPFHRVHVNPMKSPVNRITTVYLKLGSAMGKLIVKTVAMRTIAQV